MTTELRDGDLTLEPTTGSDDVIGFAAILDGERIGTVALRRSDRSIRWNFAAGPGAMVAANAIRLAVHHAFGTLGWDRLQARVGIDDAVGLRAGSIAGLRREGVARMPNGGDEVLLARLSTDPATFSRDGFIAILNAGLPRKRVIGQGILRDEQHRVLLCELTYKSEWDLPGGVVESGESPATGLVRELQEELGVEVHVDSLVTMNWLPAWRGWDDACLFVFDLGTIDSSITESMTLQRTEIAAVHWCDLDLVRQKATRATLELLESLENGPLPAYREAPLQP